MTKKDVGGTTPETGQRRESGPWGAALDTLREWDPDWAETCVRMTTNPWTGGILPRKTIELMRGAERRLYQPRPGRHGRHAPPHPCRARCGSDLRRDTDGAEDGVRPVDPFVWPGGFAALRRIGIRAYSWFNFLYPVPF